MLEKKVNRRSFLSKTGALIVGFSFAPALANVLASATPAFAGTTTNALNQVDAWLAIDANGGVTVYSGKVELGTGTQTALSQIVAEELYLDFSQVVNFVQGDTTLTPNQGYTAGSQTIQGEGPLLRQAAATAFQKLLSLAATQLGVPTSQLVAKNGIISSPTDSVTYGQLIGGQQFNLAVNNSVAVKSPTSYTVVGTSVQRVDLPPKVFAEFTYVQDVVVPNMLHGRVVRPSARNASLSGTPSLPAGLPGSPQVVVKGNFVGVVATDEWAAIQAASQLNVTWTQGAPFAASDDGTATTRAALIQALQDPANTFDTRPVDNTAAAGNVASALTGAAKTRQATYFTPYQMHAAIGPSCAVADVRNGQATIWSGTQGVYPLQGAIAQLLGLSASAVHVIYVEASGCYGHNGADDAAADAALLSLAVGAPVRVQWMRPDEHGWEPLGPALVHAMQGGLDGNGNAVAWEHTLWTQTHSTRPGGLAGNLLAGQELGFAPQADSPTGGNLGGRNSKVNYAFPNYLVTNNSVRSYTTATNGSTTQTTNVFPRTTALRTLGGFSNTFANESFVDELALAANVDPLAFRKNYLSDPRGLAVLNAMATAANWQPMTWPTKPQPVAAPGTNPPPPPYRGRGIAYVQYENSLAYVATYAEVQVDPTTGSVQVTRVIVAHDCGLVINPDGLTNQIEGNVIQATSRTLKEEVLFDANGVTSTTWAGVPTNNTWSIKYKAGPSYPILHFTEVPSVQVLLLDQPTQPAWGAGEPASETMAAAIGNAVFSAIGVRLRQLPFTPANVLAAWKAALASTTIAANFNGTSIAPGNTLWFNGVLKLSGASTSAPTILQFTNQTISFSANGITYSQAVPDSVVAFDPSATTATTSFDAVSNTWRTATPYGLSGNTFLSGLAYAVPSGGLPGGIKSVTWNGTISSSVAGVSVSWKWACAVYTQFGTSYNAVGVKPTDANQGSMYLNSDHAGTPENEKSYVTGGAMGGGGSNYTGGYSGTVTVKP